MRLIAGILMLVATAVAADQRYISDELSITLRKGQGTQFQIVSMLKSGAAVEVLEDDPASGYSLIRTSRGREGWVLTRFLSRQPVARQRIAGVEQKLTAAQQEIRQLRGSLRDAVNERDEIALDRSALENENAALRNQIEDLARSAARPLALRAENERLREREKALESQLNQVTHAHDTMLERREHLLVGAGILVFGLLLGIVLPRLGRRRSDWEGLG